MKVIGAGLGRTGTLSTQAALEELGFGPCYHMEELLMKHPEHADTWVDALHGRPVDWKTFFKDYQATVDYPGCNYYQALMAVYPDAKVILNVRDPEKWYESAYQTIYAINKAIPSWIWLLNRQRAKFREIVGDQIWKRQFGDFENREASIEIFVKHNEAVKQYVPPDRLLVFDVKQGWAPLCEFLGVPIPQDKPFPHLNDTAEFRKRVRIVRLIRWLVPLMVILVPASVIALFIYRRRK
ncbi:MAG: sulfotransferase family protein [Chloroflexi bacterium]|nr:sulfotransferase family protein [Chloroflexota bacterium]